MIVGTISRESIIDVTILYIEQNNGLNDVSMRKIAKVIGCSHTNIYNYFMSFGHLYDEAKRNILETMIGYSIRRINRTKTKNERFQQYISQFIEFLLYYRIWHKLIFTEPNNNLTEVINKHEAIFSRELKQYCGKRLPLKKITRLKNTIRAYIHGEILLSYRDLIDINDKKKMMVKEVMNIIEQEI